MKTITDAAAAAAFEVYAAASAEDAVTSYPGGEERDLEPVIAGVRVPPVCKADIRAAAATGYVIFHRTASTTHPRIRCTNCNDTGIVHFQACKGPFADPSGSFVTWGGDGWYVVKKDIVHPCPICTSTADRIQYLFDRSGLAAHECEWRVDYIKGRRGKEFAYATALDILAGVPNPTGLYIFYGSWGVGKTGLAKAVVAQAIKAGVSARYVTAYKLLEEIKNSFGDRSQYTPWEIRSAIGAHQILVVDEVDKVPDKDWSLKTLESILDDRYSQRQVRATIIISNQRPEELWPYLADRLNDGIKVPVGGDSLRGQ